MFQQRHFSRSGFTYDLTYPTPHNDHLVRGFESTKRVARRDTPSVCMTLVEDLNEIVSCIVHLNEKIYELRRKHEHGSKSLLRAKTSTNALNYKGYGHETHQCPNWNATLMSNEDLQNYMLYLKRKKK